MKKLTAITLVLIVFTIVGVIKVTSTIRKQQELADLDNAKDKGSLRWHVKVAKLKGETQVALPGPEMGQYVDSIKDLDTALSLYTAIVAQPVESKSLLRPYDRVVTFYRLKVLENVSRRPLNQCVDCAVSSYIPKEMLPIQQDEIVIANLGGTVTVDGIEVRIPTALGLELHEKYFLFVKADPSGTFGEVRVGPKGTFKVQQDETLIPIIEDEHPLQRFMKERKDSLKELRKELKEKSVKT